MLTAQAPLSEAHDEMLFIIQHQSFELWTRLALHELTLARDDFPNAFKTFARLARIFDQLNGAWDVLRTMTPSYYTRLYPVSRPAGPKLGLSVVAIPVDRVHCGQSQQRDAGAAWPHRPDLLARLEAQLQLPSLNDAALAALVRAGFALPERVLSRDWAAPRAMEAEVTAAWVAV